jgi:hypothetical protein
MFGLIYIFPVLHSSFQFYLAPLFRGNALSPLHFDFTHYPTGYLVLGMSKKSQGIVNSITQQTHLTKMFIVSRKNKYS